MVSRALRTYPAVRRLGARSRKRASPVRHWIAPPGSDARKRQQSGPEAKALASARGGIHVGSWTASRLAATTSRPLGADGGRDLEPGIGFGREAHQKSPGPPRRGGDDRVAA